MLCCFVMHVGWCVGDKVVRISKGAVRVSGGLVLVGGWYRMYVIKVQSGTVQYSTVTYTPV